MNMTEEVAINVLDQVTATIPLARDDNLAVMQALQVLRVALQERMTLQEGIVTGEEVK